jgi:hypothetical protein
MNLKKILGFLAVGGLLVVAAPNQPAQAASLINPGIAATVQDGSTAMTTEVQYRRHRHYHPRRHWHRPYVHPRHHWHPRRHHHHRGHHHRR